MKKRSKRTYDDDDGRVIAPMNVDGMSWSLGGHASGAEPRKDKRDPSAPDQEEISLTAEEKRAMMGGVFAAALLIAGVFVLVGLLFVLFCVFFWLK